MANARDLILMVLRTFPAMLTDLNYLLIIALVFFIVYKQYQKIALYEQRLFGLRRIKPLQETGIALVYGLIAGVIATTLFVVLGVSLTDSGIIYLWFTALILMLFHPRFLCFAYAGGLVSFSSLLFGWPQVDVAALMALVAILHLAESILIAVDGQTNASPMYVKRNGKVVGGFTMQRFWPLPFVALLGIMMLESGVNMEMDTVAMPDWWPLFSPSSEVLPEHTIMYVLFPVIAALGYGDMAVTDRPSTKTRWSALYLTVFSVVLLGLALLANRVPAMAFVAALFAPLGHELVIHLGQRRENKRPPAFTCTDGVMVLTVYPNSPAEKMGLGPGDIIRSVNGRPIKNLPELVQELSPWAVDPVFEVESKYYAESPRKVTYQGKVPPLGIIPTPHPEQRFFVKTAESPLKALLNRLRGMRK